MLKELHIKNALGIDDLSVKFGKITVLTGRNFTATSLIIELIHALGGSSSTYLTKVEYDRGIYVETSDRSYHFDEFKGDYDDCDFDRIIDLDNVGYPLSIFFEKIKRRNLESILISCLNNIFPLLGMSRLDQLYGRPMPILAGLLLSENGVVIDEYPENGLHPDAQIILGKMLCKHLSSTSQLIILTHSKTLLNGIRSSVVDGVISPPDLSINHFMDDGEVIQIRVDGKGRYSQHPEGFIANTQEVF